MIHPMTELLQNRKHGKLRGIYSCCSSNEYVIRAVLRRAKAAGIPALIEATANQVNQSGGYTGMLPADFRDMVFRLAEQERFPLSQLILGGDHLGPLTWQNLPEKEAMDNAETLVSCYAGAGFSKIHLDTSMRVADDDPEARLPDEVIARRSARLCRAAETAYAEYQKTHPGVPKPVYIIGSEVPIPGGSQENEDSVAVTTPEDCENTLNAFRNAYREAGIGEEVWSRITAIVVQPGVEFADSSVVEYNSPAARDLLKVLDRYPQLVFEGHSTDYQPKECLRQMAEDGIAILKVGPALTFALREGLFALERIERELIPDDGTRSRFRGTLETVMLQDSRYWKKYYFGTLAQQRYARAFSYSDRARYYLTDPRVRESVDLLMKNLGNAPVPPALISQYFPVQYRRVRDGELSPDAESLLLDRIGDTADDYLYAILRG